MRARPKRIEFPALRLLEARRVSNARRMKLRHLLLLLLRIAVVIAVVLALTRPSLPPARYGLVWYEWLALALVVGAAIPVYRFLSHRAANEEAAEFLLRDRRARLRAFTVIGTAAAMLLCVGLPWGLRVSAEIESPRNDLADDIPVAAVFIFDTSVSMSYRHESLTRLDQARQIANDHLQSLPAGSRVAVTGTGPDDAIVFQADLAGAQSRIESLTTKPHVQTLNSVLREAVDIQRDDEQLVRSELGATDVSDLFSREIFIFTDLSKSAWSLSDQEGMRDLLLENKQLHVFVIDVSVEQPINLSLQNLRLSNDSTVAGRVVDLAVDVVRTTNGPSSATVEAYLVDELGQQSRVTAPAHVTLDGDSATAHMPIPVPRGAGFQAGLIRISSSDPLQADDLRYFSLGVQARPKVLLIADRKKDADHLRVALIANDTSPTSKPYYDCTFTSTSQIRRVSLSDYNVVCLVNCQRPDRELWDSLGEWVEDGGALFAVAGGLSPLVAERWNVEECESLLPALLLLRGTFRERSETFRFDTSHPITNAFEYDIESKTDFLGQSVRRYWKVRPDEDSRVIMSYTGPGNYPALLERQVGKGRSLMLTTAVDYTPNASKQWNDMPIHFSFLMFAEEIIQYLTGAADQRHNFVAGDAIEVLLPAGRQFDEYLLRRPGPRQTVGRVDASEQSVLIEDAHDPGHYLFRSRNTDGFRSEFAVNLEDGESDLTPVENTDLDDVLGEGRYSLVKSPAELQRAVMEGRLGVEVFPVLLGLLIMMFCGEHLMANYFYDEDAAPAPVPQNA